MTIVTNTHLLRPVFTMQDDIPSPRGPDLSFSRWRRCYKSRGSFPVYLASEVQKRSNVPVPGQKLATKVSKSRAIPPYVPGVNPPGWPLISALITVRSSISVSKRYTEVYSEEAFSSRNMQKKNFLSPNGSRTHDLPDTGWTL